MRLDLSFLQRVKDGDSSRLLAAAVVAASVFAVYVATLYPDVPGGDSGELIGAVATGGVIHPPGYPLYGLLGRAFALIPFGTLAWRENLLSAACDALAAGALYLAVARWSRSGWAGITTAFAFAFAPGVWLYAISAEVFALNNLFVATLILLAVAHGGEVTKSDDPERPVDRRYAYLTALTCGLALANHHTVVFFVAPLAIWTLWQGGRALLAPRPLAIMASLFVAGLLPYALLCIGHGDRALVSWGTTDTWAGFWTHVLRRDYGPLHLAEGASTTGRTSGTLGAWLADLPRQLGWWATPLVVAGAFVSARSAPRGLSAALAAALVLAVLVFAFLWGLPASDPLHREILARFWQEPDITCFVWMGWGVAALGRYASEVPGLAPFRRGLEPTVASASILVAFALRVGELDHHASRTVRAYGAEILRAAPPGALLFTKGDLITNTSRYLQLAEGMRPDVVIVDLELLGYPWYARRIGERYPDVHIPGARYMPGAADGFFMKQLLDANFDRSPILVCGGVKDGDRTADTSYGLWPFGLCDWVHRGTEAVNLDEWVRQSDAALPRISFSPSQGERWLGGLFGSLRSVELDGATHPPGSWEDIAWGDYWLARINRGAHLVTIAGADPTRRHYLATAADIFQGILTVDPAPPPLLYKDLALAIGRQGLETPADRARAAAAWRSYVKVAPPTDPQLPAIQKELDRLGGT